MAWKGSRRSVLQHPTSRTVQPHEPLALADAIPANLAAAAYHARSRNHRCTLFISHPHTYSALPQVPPLGWLLSSIEGSNPGPGCEVRFHILATTLWYSSLMHSIGVLRGSQSAASRSIPRSPLPYLDAHFHRPQWFHSPAWRPESGRMREVTRRSVHQPVTQPWVSSKFEPSRYGTAGKAQPSSPCRACIARSSPSLPLLCTGCTEAVTDKMVEAVGRHCPLLEHIGHSLNASACCGSYVAHQSSS